MLFGVQDPDTGTIGYCSVLGALGEVFALNVYIGREGLNSYWKLYRQLEEERQNDAMYTQLLLMASFEDRKNLDRRDLGVIEDLGLKFKGRRTWPQFRDYAPGLYPWYIDAGQARHLTHALRQALEVALRVRKDPGVLQSDQPDHILVRTPHMSAEGVAWTDSWLPPEASPVRTPIAVLPAKRDLKRLRDKAAGNEVWEVDYIYVPTTIQEKSSERPYYPKMLMIVEAASGMVLGHDLFRPDTSLSVVQSEFLRALGRKGDLPCEVRVRSEGLAEIIRPGANAVGVRLQKVESLPALEMAYEAIDRFMTSGGG